MAANLRVTVPNHQKTELAVRAIRDGKDMSTLVSEALEGHLGIPVAPPPPPAPVSGDDQ